MRTAGAASAGTGLPVVLFGACDRHNFGDLLFAHVAGALLPGRELIHAGLVHRDLRRHGGHAVGALAGVVAALDGRPFHFVHVGGELLTCEAWQAAVMLQPQHIAREIVARLHGRPAQGAAWAREVLGVADRAPYAVARARLPGAAAIVYNAVGGVDLDRQDAALRAEVVAKLQAADAVGVRDRQTQAALEAAGVPAALLPDPGVLVAELWGTPLRRRARQGEVAAIRRACPQGYIAIQFSADFGDDATLGQIANQLDEIAAATGYGIVFFRAGAAPWHDDLECYRRAAARMRAPAQIFHSLQLWDICALIVGARAYSGSSLHGRIVATAFALPRLSLLPTGGESGASKLAAYADTWEAPDLRGVIGVDAIAAGLEQALQTDGERLQGVAAGLAARYREGFAALRAALG